MRYEGGFLMLQFLFDASPRQRIMRSGIMFTVTMVTLSFVSLAWEPRLVSANTPTPPPTMTVSGNLPACSTALNMRPLQTPQPVTPTATATTDPNAPSATPRPPAPTLLPAPSVDNVGFAQGYQSSFTL